jgi:DNA-binding phage protein
MCMDCHLREHGWIEVDDQVRELSSKGLAFAAAAFEKDGKDRGRRIRQKYLTIDYNELLMQDQAVTEAAILAATGGVASAGSGTGSVASDRGLTPAEVRREVIETIRTYLQEPVTLEQLAFELGTSQEHLVRAIENNPGLPTVFTSLRAGKKARRDQIESAYGSVATVLYRGR